MRIRDEQKEKLIREKAIAMIAKTGFEGLSMHKLAKACGLSVNTIYIYFRHREDLLLSVFEEVSDRITEATLKGFDPKMHLEKGVKKLWMNRYHYFIKHPQHLFLMEHFNNSGIISKAQDKNGRLFTMLMTEFTGHAIKRKELAKIPAETYWAITFSPLFQLLKFHHRNRAMGKKPYRLTQEAAEEACELVLRAICK